MSAATSTAAKIVITREDIRQCGDSNLGDVMRRLPGVTSGGRPGRPGPPAMRGMGGGFTQILIDGQRIPPGFSIEQLSPDQVERIEIYRAPTAGPVPAPLPAPSTSSREPLRQTNNDLRLAIASERGLVVPEASWTRNDTLATTAPGATLTARTRHQYNGNTIRKIHLTSIPPPARRHWMTKPSATARRRARTCSAMSAGSGGFGNGEQFGVQLLGGHSTSDNKGQHQPDRIHRPRQPMLLSQYKFGNNFDFARINLNLNKRLNDTTRYSCARGFSGFQSDTETARQSI